MSKVLVTGGCGFLGSHVCEHFKEQGWEVLAYDNLTKFEYDRTGYNSEAIRGYNLGYLESLGIPTLIADIRDPKFLTKVVRQCNLIIHCAAQPAMTIALEDPFYDFDVNVRGTLNVLRAAMLTNTPIVNCSTIHIYGNEGINVELEESSTRFRYVEASIAEEHPLLTGTLTPLHASKRATELYTQTYADCYALQAASFRLTGIYGPRQFGGEDHGWVANFAIRTILGLPIKIFGTDKQVRDILYVKDAARAFYDWYIHGCPSGIFNIGGGDMTATSIGECLSILEGLTSNTPNVEVLPKREGDLWWFISDYSKATEAFGWVPQYPPEEGLGLLVDWIDENKEWFRCSV